MSMYEELVHEPGYVSDPRIPWNIDEPRTEELRLLDILDEAQHRPQQLALAAEVATQVARARLVQGRLTEAGDMLSTNERRLRSLSVPTPRIRQLLERGRLKARERIVDTARLLLVQAYNAAREAGDAFLAVDAAQVLALVDPPKHRDAWLTKATELAEASGDPAVRRWLPALAMIRGWRALAAERAAAALADFDHAATGWEAAGEPVLLVRARRGRARALRLLGRHEEAAHILRRLMNADTAGGLRDGRTLEELGECLLAGQQPRTAQAYFAEAHRLLSVDPYAMHDDERLGRIQRLGKG